MQYSQVNKSHIFDHQSNKLVKLSSLSGVVVETPWWLWPYGLNETTLNIKGNAHHCTEGVRLNNLVISSWYNTNSQGAYVNKMSQPTSQALIYPVIKFKDVKTGELKQITIDIIASVSGNDTTRPHAGVVGTVYPATVAGIAYNLITTDGARRFTTQYPDSLSGFSELKECKMLGMFSDEFINKFSNLNFGLPSKQFSIVYQGKPLEGKCYAYMLGTFAILLRDDFSFDSLVALSGCSDGCLVADKFMFSTNAVIQSLMGWG